jgi:hypothetical protein
VPARAKRGRSATWRLRAAAERGAELLERESRRPVTYQPRSAKDSRPWVTADGERFPGTKILLFEVMKLGPAVPSARPGVRDRKGDQVLRERQLRQERLARIKDQWALYFRAKEDA